MVYLMPLTIEIFQIINDTLVKLEVSILQRCNWRDGWVERSAKTDCSYVESFVDGRYYEVKLNVIAAVPQFECEPCGHKRADMRLKKFSNLDARKAV